MTELPSREIPWPGPRPYEEGHWRTFFGRAGEVRRVVSSVGVKALSVLLGGSGTGKTSLVRAGAVPELRNRRYHPRGSLTQWPVLVLRRWGAESGTTVNEILHDQLAVAIDAIEEWAEREGHEAAHADAGLFRSLLEAEGKGESITDTLLGVAEGISGYSNTSAGTDESAGGLIVVFDQFEELLRPGGQTSSDAIAVVQELYERGSKRIHMLLSLRQEFVYALRPLESTVGGLAGRSVVLSPMPQKTVLDVIGEASGSSEVRIQEEAAARIVHWLAEAAAKRGGKRARKARSDTKDGEATLQVSEAAGTPDLLKLQAVLRELFVFARTRNKRTVSLNVLEQFELYTLEQRDALDLAVQQDEDSEGRVAELIVDGALERWIEYALKATLPEEGPLSSAHRAEESSDSEEARTFDALTSDFPGPELYRQVRRVAIRIAPHLTALDYKVPQEENDLFRLALGDEVWKLGMKTARHRDRIRIVDEEVPRLNWDELEISDKLTEAEKNYMSGLAKMRGWSPAETGDRLTACFRETLHRLKRGNILTRIVKAGEGERTSVWELVHDQFGPAFLKWSHEHRDSWYDCEGSLTVSSGIQPIMAPRDRVEPSDSNPEYTLERISWRGCSIEPGKHDRLLLRDVHFIDCYLVGMVFDRCRFEGCSFRNCDLNGALFRNCEFIDSENGAPVFEKCDSSSLAIVASKIGNLEFMDCELQQTTIMANLEGEVRFTEGSRVALAYFEVRRGESDRGKILFERKSRAFFCSADINSLELISYGAQRDVASGALPDGFFRRRARQDLKS